jgi:hypothetical protein
MEKQDGLNVKSFEVRPLGLFARLADFLMIPVMYILSGTLETPQKTHLWNNIKLKVTDVQHLNQEQMLHCKGVKGAMQRINPISHLQIIGGWRNYVVLQPVAHEEAWYAGWITKDAVGVSQILLHGPVRLLLGPTDVSFFGISLKTNTQITIQKVSEGRIGEGGQYTKTPLL